MLYSQYSREIWNNSYIFFFLVSSSAPSIGGSVSAPSSTSNISAAALRELYGSSAAGPGHPLASLVSQQRFLELSRFGLRHYDLAQHMLTQQGAVTKLLGKSLHSTDLNYFLFKPQWFLKVSGITFTQIFQNRLSPNRSLGNLFLLTTATFKI